MKLRNHLPRDVQRISPAHAFYAHAVRILREAHVPFLVGGAFALDHHARIQRDTKDLDLFIMGDDVDRALHAFEARGIETSKPFPHWLAKAKTEAAFLDLIWDSGNGLTQVDAVWFHHAEPSRLFGEPVLVCPAEETIWSKSFVMERERFDGADVLHLIAATGDRLDWPRLLARYGAHWRVLLGHLVLLPYVFPDRASVVPRWVEDALMERAREHRDEGDAAVCRGTLLSREQYLVDLDRGYQDARLPPTGTMTPEAIATWTAAIATRE